ncbi:MAG: hypothetical protein J7L62_00965 [Candidatus Aminicenantes bacterium]|nr:hypothetical protein [Candidatus Aminicenantes bacterium]
MLYGFLPNCVECLYARIVISGVIILTGVGFYMYLRKKYPDQFLARKIAMAFTVFTVLVAIFTTPTVLCVQHYEKLIPVSEGDDTKIISLAEKLAKDGWILFYSSNCPACRKQVEIFGSEFWRLNSINVDYVNVRGITYIPAWYNPQLNETVEGFQPIEKLVAMANLTSVWNATYGIKNTTKT